MHRVYDSVNLSAVNPIVLSNNGLDKNIDYNIPLEIIPFGQFKPLYKMKLSVQAFLLLFHQ